MSQQYCICQENASLPHSVLFLNVKGVPPPPSVVVILGIGSLHCAKVQRRLTQCRPRFCVTRDISCHGEDGKSCESADVDDSTTKMWRSGR